MHQVNPSSEVLTFRIKPQPVILWFLRIFQNDYLIDNKKLSRLL
jgi:hypothetical protein